MKYLFTSVHPIPRRRFRSSHELVYLPDKSLSLSETSTVCQAHGSHLPSSVWLQLSEPESLPLWNGSYLCLHLHVLLVCVSHLSLLLPCTASCDGSQGQSGYSRIISLLQDP